MDSDYFIGTYPQITEAKFNQQIWKRKEFHDQDIETSGLKGHQRRLQRYASPVTPYDEVLLFHEMGTGKTRSALAIAENALSSGMKKVVIIGPNRGVVQKVFTKELSKMKNIDVEDAAKYMRKKYLFSTYGTFSENYIRNKSPQSLKKNWNKTVFILDEVHNMTRNMWRKGSSKTTFNRFKYLFNHDITPTRKIVLLSGTPMVDDARDIIPLMELILPNVKFTMETLAQHSKGRVSYLKSDIRSGAVPTVVVEGKLKKPMQKLKLDYVNMSKFQTEAYNQVLQLDKNESAFLINQRNVALFAFPEKNENSKLTSAKDWCTGNAFSKDFWFKLFTNKSIDIEKVRKYSCKFANVLEKLRDGPWPIYVYSTPTGDGSNCPGPGLKLLRLILEKMGYGEFTGKGGRGGNKFIYFTSESVPSDKTINKFNNIANKAGKMCKIILGSKASSEGWTFRNLKREIILTPHWNYDANGKVTISRLVAVPNGSTATDTDIIDLKLYSVSEQKDVEIKKVERILKVNSFDCPYNYQQNSRRGENSRDCEYGKCFYKCEDIDGTPSADGGYRLPELYTKTWEKYYAPRGKIIAKLKTIFKTSSSVQFEDLVEGFKDTVGKKGLLRVLSELLVNRTVIRKDNNRNCYLSNYKNKINLTLDLIEPVGKAVVVAPYYIENQVLLSASEGSIRQLERNLTKNNLAEYLKDPDKLFQKPNSECEECANISTLPIPIQEKLLEDAVLAADAVAVARKITSYFSAAIFNVNGRTVSALQFTFGSPKDRLRELKIEDGKWIDASEELTTEYKKKYEGTTVNDEIVALIVAQNPNLVNGNGKLNDSPETVDALLKLSIGNLRVETSKEVRKKKGDKLYLEPEFEVDISQFSAKKLSIGKDAQSLKKHQLAAIFIYAGIDFDMTDIMKDGDYFPWIGKSKTGPIYPIQQSNPDKVKSSEVKHTRDFIKSNAPEIIEVDDAKLRELLSINNSTSLAILYKKLKQMNRLFLDVDCGSAFKDRKNAKIMKNLDGKVYGLFNYDTCTLCIKGPLWLTSATK